MASRAGKATKPVEPLRPTRRGWDMPGGGAAGVVVPAPEWRGTTVQVCGLWPFIAGVGTPMVGVPLGHHLFTGATVCSDPISWFAHAGLIPNPSMLVLGRPGLGKSTMVRRMATGLAAYGVHPLVFGDLKPDYRLLVEALGGAVIELGRGRGRLNVLDPGSSAATADRLTGEARRRLLAEAHGRRLTMLAALVGLNRASRATDHEEAVLAAALRVLDEHHAPGEATLVELIQVLSEGPPGVRAVTLDRGHEDRYRDAVDPLQRSLAALVEGALGDVFAHRTTTSIDLDRPLCIDVSGISESDEKLQAAVLLACWGEGFGAVTALQALTDAGLAPQRNFLVVLDELWRVLRAGAGLIDRIDALTRLDRQTGVGTIIVTHTLKDLLAVSEQDRPKAQGFAERMGYYAMAGVPSSELAAIRDLVPLSHAEGNLITSWSTPETWDPSTGQRGDPPGLGKMLLKVGGRPGIPVQLRLTSIEKEVNDTNRRWQTAAAPPIVAAPSPAPADDNGGQPAPVVTEPAADPEPAKGEPPAPVAVPVNGQAPRRRRQRPLRPRSI